MALRINAENFEDKVLKADRTVPTVIAFVNGEEKGRTVGLKEPEEIETLFENYV